MRDVISNETIKEINAVIDEILTNIDDNVRNIVGAGNYSLPTIFSYTNYSGQTVSVHGSTFRHEIIIDNADGNNLIGDICTIIGDRNGIKLAKAGVEDRHDAFANYWDSTFDIAYDSDTAINGYVFDMQSGLVGEGTGQSKVMSFKLDNLEAGKAYTLTFCGKFVNAQFVSGQESLVRICSTTAETPYLAQVTLEKDTDAHIYRIDFTNNTQDTTLYLNFWFYGVADDTETYHSEFIADDLIIAGMNIGIISRYIDYNGKWYPIEAGGGTSDLDAIELTYAEYQALTPAEKTDPDKIYFITDYPSGSGVVINPTGTATDTAETIEVDGTIYDFMDADAVHTADIGVAGGVAELDANGKVPSSQLPRYVPIRKDYDTYTQLAKWYGGATEPPYVRIAFPTGISTVWTMLNIEILFRQNYANDLGGKILINCHHNQTSPYAWVGNATVYGFLRKGDIKVYGSDGHYLYIEGIDSYTTLSIDKVLVGDTARSVDFTDTTIDYVSALPSGYQTLTMYTDVDSSNISSQSVDKATKDGDGNTISSTYTKVRTTTDNANYNRALDISAYDATKPIFGYVSVISNLSAGANFYIPFSFMRDVVPAGTHNFMAVQGAFRFMFEFTDSPRSIKMVQAVDANGNDATTNNTIKFYLYRNY